MDFGTEKLKHNDIGHSIVWVLGFGDQYESLKDMPHKK
jgi:hypothetical protein